MTNPGNDGIPQHAAASGGLLASLPGRTIVQGVAVDVLLAVCLVVYNVASSDNLDWLYLWGLVVKSFLMTVASSIMKRLKPPPVEAVTN